MEPQFGTGALEPNRNRNQNRTEKWDLYENLNEEWHQYSIPRTGSEIDKL